MRPRALTLVAFVMGVTSSAHARDLQVVTFNAGLLDAVYVGDWGGGNLVPCVQQRLAVLKTELFRHVRPPFAILLQEVWGPDSYRVLSVAARQRGYFVSKSSVAYRGTMIISSEPLVDETFAPYSVDSTIEHRGVLSACILWEGSPLMLLATHTSYSEGKEPSSIHRRQLGELADFARRTAKVGSVVLGGDLNSSADFGYREQSYDPVEKIWTPFVSRLGETFRSLTFEGHTWNGSVNPLVARPAFPIAWTGGWPERPGTLDAILLTEDLRAQGTRLILNEPLSVPRCEVTLAGGASFLSDHFGITTFVGR